jgi:DNA repair protein RecN (Recombination protein N)
MLIGLAIRDLVLIESLDLAPGPGLTALTGETGAGKSIILDALGLATGARGDAALVRRGAAQAVVTATFAPAPGAPVWAVLDEKGLTAPRDEDLVLRRVLGADGRSRAFVNDQPVGVALLRELGALLTEVHGQHETVGLLDARTHLSLLDRVGGCEPLARSCAEAWSLWRAAAAKARTSSAARDEALAQCAALSEQLSELDRLAPLAGEATTLNHARAIMGAAEKTLADIASARDHLDGERLTSRLGQAYRALERARQRVAVSGADPESSAPRLVDAAAQALDRALAETTEAIAAVDAAAEAFSFEPEGLERAEERLFALRAMGRRLGVDPDELAGARGKIAAELLAHENADETAAADEAAARAARSEYDAAAAALSAARRAAGDRLSAEVQAELAPLKLDKARFRVGFEALPPDRAGPLGVDKVEFEISTLPGAPFQSLSAIASGGELARFALALKACLARRFSGPQPLMIFDEVDQGVGGAVADAIGLRLGRLSAGAQVLVVTHSPQIAARADAQWRVRKAGDGEALRAVVDALAPDAREEEIARMLAGAEITEAARAAARALMHA